MSVAFVLAISNQLIMSIVAYSIINVILFAATILSKDIV